MPLTIQRTQGVLGESEFVSPQRRSVNGGWEDAGDLFADEPAITCQLWPGDNLPVAATLPAAWYVGADAVRVIAVDFPVDVMTALEVGWYSAVVVVASTGRAIAGFRLETTPGPGSGVRRPAYTTYQDLLDEAPWVRRLADEAYDQIGFAESAAEARDWLDAAILDAVRAAWRAGQFRYEPIYVDFYRPWLAVAVVVDQYTAALAADGLALDTPDGRRLHKAVVYKAMAVVLSRAVAMANPPVELLDTAKEYDAKAHALLAKCRLAEIAGLDPIPLNAVTVGRLTR